MGRQRRPLQPKEGERMTQNRTWTSYVIFVVVLSPDYDDAGTPYSFNYNNGMYFYVFNAQGDVTGILDLTGNLVVQYSYDSWGRPISVTGSLVSTVGQANPFRYRGYYYDQETQLYYLNSRYYDPQTGRFINADGLVTSGGLLGNNMFAYCENNPVNRCDCSGHCSHCNEFAAYISNILNAAVAVVAAASCPPDAVQALISATAQAQAELTAFVARMHPPTPPAAPAKTTTTRNSPTSNSVVTCVFNCTNKSHGHVKTGHTGTDFGAVKPGVAGDKVFAVTKGTVVYTGSKRGGGNNVWLSVDNGKYIVKYLHLKSISVKEGDEVVSWDVVGIMGNSGTKQVHLHLTVYDTKLGENIDPLPWLGIEYTRR